MRQVTGLAFLMAVMATPAWSQTADAPTMLPPDQRLGLADVFLDASPVNRAVMVGLIIATVVAVVLWAVRLTQKVDVTGWSLSYFRGLKGAGPFVGATGAAYTLLLSFIAVSNVRPSPSLTVMAPGIAEAILQILLGLLAAAVAVVCERHLEGRIRRAAAAH
jgi:biopolymer transport protein ExbB/TolQ